MARPIPPTIHDVKPEEIAVLAMADRHLSVEFANPARSGLPAGAIYIAGDSDRERLNNLLAIAQRMRTAALDLIAELANNPGEEWYTSTGEPASFPEAAPLHGTTVRRVAS